MLLWSLLSCTIGSPQADADAPDVVLVIIDTLRADRMGFAGHSRPTTPHLDAFTAQATWFSRAYAASSWTLPSTATLFTGVLPSEHRVVHDYRDPELFGSLEDRFETLAEHLRSAGYRTAGVVGGPALVPELGVAQGFELYEADFGDEAFRFNGRRAAAVADRAIASRENDTSKPGPVKRTLSPSPSSTSKVLPPMRAWVFCFPR